MYFDNLTIAGIFVVSLYGLLPLLFGGEILRVNERDANTRRRAPDRPTRSANESRVRDCPEQPEPC